VEEIEDTVAKRWQDISKKYPEIMNDPNQRDIIRAYYEIESIKTQKLHNKTQELHDRVIIGLQIANLVLIAILIYVTWVKGWLFTQKTYFLHRGHLLHKAGYDLEMFI